MVKACLRCWLRKLTVLSIMGVISIALLVSIAALSSPFIQQYQTEIETWLSHRFAAVVKINHITLSWGFYQPIIKLTGVTITKPAQQFYVKADTLRIACAMWNSILTRTFVPDYMMISKLQAHYVVKGVKQPDAMTTLLTADKIKLNFLDDDQSMALKGYHLQIQNNHLFANTLSLQQLVGNIQFKSLQNTAWSVLIPSLKIWNNDLTLQVQGHVLISDQHAPFINLQAQFSVPHAPVILHYLPLRWFNPSTVNWLQQSFSGGQIKAATAIIRGKLTDFPFDGKNGKFLVTGMVDQLNMHFSPAWPALTNLKGHLTFIGNGLHAEIAHAMMGSIPITHLIGDIPSFKNDPVLSLQADPLHITPAQSMHFIAASPLRKTLGVHLSGMQLEGPMLLQLALAIPLNNTAQTRVQGKLMLHNTQLRLPAWYLTIKNLQGALQFTENRIYSSQLLGKLFDKPLTLSFKTTNIDNVSAMDIDLTNMLTAKDVQHWLSIPLASVMHGVTQVKAHIQLSNRQSANISVHSTLKGMTVMLPGNYGKSPQATRAFQVDIQVNAQKITQMHLQYDHVLAEVIPTYQGEDRDEVWKIFLKSNQMTGTIYLPVQTTPDQPIVMQFQQLDLDALLPTASTATTFNVPAIHLSSSILFNADAVYYRDVNLGKMHLHIQPRSSGLAIQSWQLTSPLVNLQAEGHIDLDLAKQQYQVSMAGKMHTEQASKLLTAFGFSIDNVVLYHGEVTFNLHWEKSSLIPTMKDIQGIVSLSLHKGRILELSQSNQTEIWLGQLLNILSLQTIPRRLSLDFSDFLQKGYSFDLIQGDFDFAEGRINTKQANMEGPVATVKISGDIDTSTKNCDFVLSITPHVTASLPVAAAILTGQPVIGLATLVVSQVVNSQISKVTTYYYSVTGAWNNLIWEPIQTNRKQVKH